MRRIKKLIKATLIVGIMLLTFSVRARVPPDSIRVGAQVLFEENLGQWDARVCYKALMANAVLFAERDAFTFVVSHATDKDDKKPHLPHHHQTLSYHAYRMTFDGCRTIEPHAVNPIEAYSNYYTNRSPSRWRSHVKSYEQMSYEELYNGIDLIVYAAEGGMKYNFYLKPHADVSQIAIRYAGTDGLRVARDGSLHIKTSVAEIVERMPVVYQPSSEGQRPIAARYKLDGATVSIELGDYEPSLPVVIDPELIFSTFTGSTADNWGTTAAYDSHKNTYTAGLVFDVGYPSTLGALQPDFVANADVGIFKFDTSGSRRLYATYLGGSQADMPHSMYVNDFDELVIFGTTGSADFPVTPNAFDTSFGGGTSLYYEFNGIPYPNGSDIFVSRFSEDGSRLGASTYVGGSDNDGLNFRHNYNLRAYRAVLMHGNDSLYYNYGDGARGELITDKQNNVYVGSTTFSSDFPTSAHCIQGTLHGGQEGVIFKLDYNLRQMLWSTFIGGTADDAVYSIDVDSSYNLIACGGTCSADFPTTPDAYNSTYNGGSTDGFICKVTRSGDRLLASTLFGSDAYDQCYFVRRGSNDDIFIFGQTKAAGSTLIHNANYNVPNSGQFLARLAPNLDSLVWSTVFGTGNGKPNISPTAFVADQCNRVYAVGWGRDFVGYYADTTSQMRSNIVQWRTGGTTGMEVTPDAFQSETDGQDFYIMSLSTDASTLDYATFFGEVNPNPDGYSGTGSDHVDGGTSRFDRLGGLYQSVCGGCGGSSSFPTTANAWSRINNSQNCNNAVFRFRIHNDYPIAEFSNVPVGCAPYTVTFNNTGRGTSFEWSFGDGTTSNDINPRHTFARSGEYTVRLVAQQDYGCAEYDTIERTIRVIDNTVLTFPTLRSCEPGATLQIGPEPQSGCIYNWVQGSVSDRTIANPTVTKGGTYVLQIRQEHGGEGCMESDTFHVVYYSLIDDLKVSQPPCGYDSIGTATVFISPQAPRPIRIFWDGVETNTTTYDNIVNAQGLHTLRVENEACSTERTFEVYTPMPRLTKSGRTTLCTGCDGEINLQMIDTTGHTYSYLWSNGDTTRHLTNVCEGTYIVEVTGSDNCIYHDTTILQRSDVLHNITLHADDSTVFESYTTTLHATEIAGCSYLWQPDNHLATPTKPSTPAQLYQPTWYYLTITDTAGCQYHDSLFVNCIAVECGAESMSIPNAFTPNDDGQNDRLCLRYQEPISKFHIAIFTRWGELVYEGDDVTACWDGRYQGTPCMPAVYYYTCQYTCAEGKNGYRKGDITLIR